MAFFRKLKYHYKHKKLSEEWALATSLKDMSELSESADVSLAHEIETDDKSENFSTTVFDLKYLGNTNIDSEKSEKSTAEAIKSVVQLSKGAKKKEIQKVKLNVSPKGITVLNATNGDHLVNVSIYKISYCSADAVNDHVFAFVGSETNENSSYEQLLCHVFYCPKRKVAHDVTLTVARCFEQAYQKWKEAIDKKIIQEELRNSNKNSNKNVLQEINKNNQNEDKIDNNDRKENNVDLLKDVLIDLSAENNDYGNCILSMKDNREFLQNTWVSFDDDINSPFNNDFASFNNNKNTAGQLLVC